MSIKLKLHTKNWLSEYKINNPINVTLTVKQIVNGIDLDRIRSEQNFRYFKNLLNTNIFGNGFKRFNKQLKMIVVREYSFNLRHHIHCIIEQPKRYSDLEFNLLIRKLWKKTLFGYSNIHIEKPTSLEREVGWFNYIMKDKIENSVDWNNSVL